MKITDPEFFYTNYIGHAPDDDGLYQKTADMIAHYVDCGMEKYLPKIYECCAEKSEWLDTLNIPRHLWLEGNLIEEGGFYLHPALSLMNPPPIFNPKTGEQIVFPYYRENVERFTLEDVVYFAEQNLQRHSEVKDIKNDIGSVKYLLGRYKPLKAKGINPLDMVLFLISDHKGERIEIIDLKKYEDEMIDKICAYIQKLKQADKYKVYWRGSLNV